MCSLVATIANLNARLLQTRLAHELVDERADHGRLLVVVDELLDLRVRRIVDDERLGRALIPFKDGDRAVAAEKLAHERALALAVGGGDARRGVHCVRRRFPCHGRVEGFDISAQKRINSFNELV